MEIPQDRFEGSPVSRIGEALNEIDAGLPGMVRRRKIPLNRFDAMRNLLNVNTG